MPVENIEKPKMKPHSDPACACHGCADYKVFIDLGFPPPDMIWKFEETPSTDFVVSREDFYRKARW
jgi:hypothetical protein